MKNTTIGILAHVDAGKTTLSESILFQTGAVKKRGRVDHGDAFLDTDEMEKKRGITIYSKLARFRIGDRPFTILDTPGHVDFSPELERVLRVLDAAVLVVSAADLTAQQGADPQVRVLWKLLQHYEVPAFLFINKIDQLLSRVPEGEKAEPEEVQAVCEKLFGLLRSDLGQGLVRFDERQICEDNEEGIAVCEDALMERVLEGGHVEKADVSRLIRERKLFPVYCGSALRNEGTEALLEGLSLFTGEAEPAAFSEEKEENLPFGAFVYKITRENGTRLTWMKITQGTLSVRDSVREVMPQVGNMLLSSEQGSQAPDDTEGMEDADETSLQEQEISEKISELRLYSGDRYEARTSVCAGEIVAAAGLSHTFAGDGLGVEESRKEEILTPIMTSSVTATDRFGKPVDDFTLLKALRELEEQEPMLHVEKEEETGSTPPVALFL